MPAIKLKCKECGRETAANVDIATGKAIECAYCGEIFPTGEVRAALDRAKAGGTSPKQDKWDSLFKDT